VTNYNYVIVNSTVSISAIGAIIILDYLIIQQINKSQLIVLNSISVSGIALISIMLFYYNNKIQIQHQQQHQQVTPTNLIF